MVIFDFSTNLHPTAAFVRVRASYLSFVGCFHLTEFVDGGCLAGWVRQDEVGGGGFLGKPPLGRTTLGGIPWVLPPPSNSDHKDYYMFSRGFLLTFTFHCYREGAISKVYHQIMGKFPFFLEDFWWFFSGQNVNNSSFSKKTELGQPSWQSTGTSPEATPPKALLRETNG